MSAHPSTDKVEASSDWECGEVRCMRDHARRLEVALRELREVAKGNTFARWNSPLAEAIAKADAALDGKTT